MRKSTLAVLLGLLLFAGPAAAQEQRAALEGVVKDNTGAVLPGVTVEAKNIAQGGVAAATTDAQGLFRFPALSVGAYEVSASLTGFTPAKFDRVELTLGVIKKLEMTMGVAGVAETVQVTAEQPLIDVKQSQRAYSMTNDQFEKLPRGRDFSTIVTQAPGANQEPKSGGISIDGSSAGENRFIIDGIETTNPQTGVQGKTMVLDFVGEVQVKSSGYAAEYGGATGGVINVVTRSGTNTFRGDAGVYYTDDGLQGDVRPTLRLVPSNSNAAEHITYAKDGDTRWDPGFGIGGPIMKDKLWFFASYFPALETIERTTNLSNGQSVTREQTDDTQNFSANASAQIAGNQRGKIAYNSSYRYIKGVLPAQNGSTSPLAVLDTNDIRPNYSLSGNYDWVVNDRFFVGARGGYYHMNQYNEGIPTGTRYQFQNSNIGLAGVPPEFQQVSGFQNYLTNRSITRNIYARKGLQADATYFANFAGQHTFKGGLQFDNLGNDVLDSEQSNLIRIQWNRTLTVGGVPQRGTYGYYQVRSNGVNPEQGFSVEGDIGNTNVGLFFQDSWTVGSKLTLNLGVRTENENVPSYTTSDGTLPVAIEWGFGSKLAPRLGFAYDLKGDGRTKFYGSWGMFYDIFKLELPQGSFGGQKWLEYYYTLDTFDYTALDPAGCPTACPGRLLQGPIDFRHPSNAPGDETIDPDLDPMRLQELAFGVEHELGKNMAFGARYIHKQVDRAIEDVGALDAQQNEIYKIANPGYGTAGTFFAAGGSQAITFPKAVRDYDAMELTFDKRLADRWAMRTSYTLSRLYGNYSGLSQSDEAGRTSPNVGRVFDYPLMAFDGSGQAVYGRLATDRPHQFKIQGNYEFPWGSFAGMNFFMMSGLPVTREAAAIPPNNFPIQYRGRLSDGRTDALSQFDVTFFHDFRIGGAKRLQLGIDVRNLFDQQTEISKFSTQLRSGQGVTFDEVAFYNGQVNFDQLISALGPVATEQDPRFLLPNDYQLPRIIRFSAKFSF